MTEPRLPLRVLVIEDDDALAAMLKRSLQVEGLFVTHARDGVEGLATYDREKPHAVLIDALLPRMTGFDVCKELRARSGDKVGLAMMSATFRTLGTRSDVHRDSGADVFIAKPFVLADLRRKLRDLATRAHAARVPAEGALRINAWVDPPKTQPGEPIAAGPFEGAHHVARALVETARNRGSGLLKIEWEGSRLELALVRGVLVGARDNLREHQLGERLLREGRITHENLKAVNDRIATGERVAEAIVSMGLCEASEALTMIEEQVCDRLVRALSWRRGTLSFSGDADQAQRLAVDSFDLLQLILAFGFDPARSASADAFVFTHGTEPLKRTHDFEEALPLLQELRPASRLIAALLTEVAADGPATQRTVDDITARAGTDAGDLYALWLAGLVRLGSDSPGTERPLPRPLLTEPHAVEVDREAGERVAGALLRVRGREPWAAVGARPDAGRAELLDRLDEMVRSVGPAALQGHSLGRRQGAAKELWALLAELRIQIDAAPLVAARTPKRAPPPPSLAPEQEFLDGQIAITLGDATGARESFERATRARPNDPDFNAWLAWAALLSGEDEAYALDLLETAAQAWPQAMRPVSFLGLAAERRGALKDALSHLGEAAARAPADVEVRKALERVRNAQPGAVPSGVSEG